MNNRQLSQLAYCDPLLAKEFQGVFAADELGVLHGMTSGCFIVNRDLKSQPGSHWNAFYLPSHGPVEYFCSYGLPPTPFQEFLENIPYKHYITSNVMLQSPISSVCGQYCLHFLHERVKGRSMDDILNAFTENNVYNDTLINNWIEEHFNVILPMYDEEFIHKQISRALTQL